MDKRKLKGWLNKENLTKEQEKVLMELWDTVLYWSGADEGYYSIKALARGFGVSTPAIYARLKRFKELFPEAYQALKEDRARVKRICRRQGKSFRNPLSWDQLKEDAQNPDWEPKIIRRF